MKYTSTKPKGSTRTPEELANHLSGFPNALLILALGILEGGDKFFIYPEVEPREKIIEALLILRILHDHGKIPRHLTEGINPPE